MTNFINRYFIVILFSLFILTIVLSFTGFYYQIGKGQHTGYVTAVSTDGIFFKTTTVYFKTDTQSSQEDYYCVIDKDLINNLEQVNKTQRQVTLLLTNYIKTSITDCGNNAEVITGISI